MLPKITPYDWAVYWVRSWGIKVGDKYNVRYSGADTHPRKGEFIGKFVGITPSGRLVFLDGVTEVVTDMGMNVTIRHI